MEKAKEVDLDDLAAGVLRCVIRLLALLERCVRTEAAQRRDSSTNAPANEDSAEKEVPTESSKEGIKGDNGVGRSNVEGELREVLQVMVGTLRRIVDDLKYEELGQPSPLPSLFDISVTSSEKNLPVTGNTPTNTTEETGSNNGTNEQKKSEADQLDFISFDDDFDELTATDIVAAEINEEFPHPDENAEGCGLNIEIFQKSAEEEDVDSEKVENYNTEKENSDETCDEESRGDAAVEGRDGGDVDEEESGESMDVDPSSEEGSGDHPPLIEEIDTSAAENRQGNCVRPDIVGEDAAAYNPRKEEAWADSAADDDWEPPQICNRVCSVTAKAADDAKATEDEDTADESCHKDDMMPSDMEYDSYFPTEDEDLSSMTEATTVEDKPEVLGLSAVRMFRRHMEMDNVNVEMFPTPRDQPKRHFFYTCRVLGYEAEACGRSKRAAKRNAISKIIRLVVKKQREGSLPGEISPFSVEELSALVKAYRSGADYLSRLRQLCCTLHAPAPTYDVQITDNGAGDKVFTVQCCALGRSAVGICAKKRSAKRHAAREIVKRYEEEAASVRVSSA